MLNIIIIDLRIINFTEFSIILPIILYSHAISINPTNIIMPIAMMSIILAECILM